MTFLIDTNIVIHARDGTEAVIAKLAEHDGAIATSALCLAELQRGMRQDLGARALRQARLEALLPRIPIMAFDVAAVTAYGNIIAQRGWVRSRDFDRMIAAHAISTRSILVTDNVADFDDIPGLQLENWVS